MIGFTILNALAFNDPVHTAVLVWFELNWTVDWTGFLMLRRSSDRALPFAPLVRSLRPLSLLRKRERVFLHASTDVPLLTRAPRKAVVAASSENADARENRLPSVGALRRQRTPARNDAFRREPV